MTTVETLGIDRLPVAEQLEIAQEIWERIDKLSGHTLSEAQRKDLEARADEDDQFPEDTIPWKEAMAAARSHKEL